MNTQIAEHSGSVRAMAVPGSRVPAHEPIVNAVSLGIVGLVAATICHFAIRQTGRVFELPDELLDIKFAEGRNQSPEVMRLFNEGLTLLNYKHAALWIGIVGAIVGTVFGLALGVMRRSPVSVAISVLGGLILGCAFAVGAGLVANWLGENIVSAERKQNIDVAAQYSMLLHGATWLVVGLGIGLGTGIGASRRRIAFALGSMCMGGIAGAAAGAFYPFVATVAMPFVDPSLTIPDGDMNRLVWLSMPIVCIGLTLGRRG
jgi:hypothetical protein